MLARIERNIIAGILIVIPVWLTIWVVTFLIRLLIRSGSPAVTQLASWFEPTSPLLSALINAEWFQSIIAVLIVLAGLFGLGELGRAVIGRKLLGWFDRAMARIPLVQTIYGAARKLAVTLEGKPDGMGRVVLIPFPSPGLLTVGLVTRVFTDPESGRATAAVFVPTTPNPSSGYVELVAVEELIELDWTVNEAMTFVMSGGAVGPDTGTMPRRANGTEGAAGTARRAAD